MPYVQPAIPKSFKPIETYVPPTEPIEGCTVYKSSFSRPACGDCRPPPMRQHDNIMPADCKLDDSTTHRLSFQCPPCIKPPCPVLPCNRNFVGEGPMSCMTTQRHDYVPKCTPKVQPIVPPSYLQCSCGIAEDVSVMQASYQPPCLHERQRSYKPIATYCQPDQPFQKETVARMSYVPWPLKQKEHYPWACKGTYVCPSEPLECTSVYKSSYFAPGHFVD